LAIDKYISNNNTYNFMELLESVYAIATAISGFTLGVYINEKISKPKGEELLIRKGEAPIYQLNSKYYFIPVNFSKPECEENLCIIGGYLSHTDISNDEKVKIFVGINPLKKLDNICIFCEPCDRFKNLEEILIHNCEILNSLSEEELTQNNIYINTGFSEGAYIVSNFYERSVYTLNDNKYFKKGDNFMLTTPISEIKEHSKDKIVGGVPKLNIVK
jgi:hypothetical protein